MNLRELEDALVNAFIVPHKKSRYRTLLANPKRRPKILDGLNHLGDLDPRYAEDLPSGTDVLSLLRSRGAPQLCHVVADVPELDLRVMPLGEALDTTEARMWGALIGCIPGRLAYYYGEAGLRRALLVRDAERAARR